MCIICYSHNIFDDDGTRIRSKTIKEIIEEENNFEAPRGSYYPDDCRERENDPNDYSKGKHLNPRHSGHS